MVRVLKGLFNQKKGLQRIILDFYNIYCLKVIVNFCRPIFKMMSC
jgi:hypothetical protein